MDNVLVKNIFFIRSYLRITPNDNTNAIYTITKFRLNKKIKNFLNIKLLPFLFKL